MAFGFLRGMGELGLTAQDLLHYASKLWRFATSCEGRRLAEHETTSWWRYVQADERSVAFRDLLVVGVTRNLVAAQAEHANARTVGLVALQLLRDLFTPGRAADCILAGPTNEVWIDPWVALCKEKYQLDYRPTWELERVEAAGGQVATLGMREAGSPSGRVLRLAARGHEAQDTDLVADHFVFALPVEVVARLCQENATLAAGDPKLAEGLRKLAGDVGWMNGVQFFLTEEVPLCRGHINLLDSPWALTAISHSQFWTGFPASKFGDGTVKTVLSVDISHFAGLGADGTEAWDCTTRALAEETWRQLKRGLNQDRVLLHDGLLHPTHPWFVDDSLAERASKQGSTFIPAPVRQRRAAARGQGEARPDLLTNAEPLLINKTDTWASRPEAATALDNLFLAGDYLRTHTNLASMEAASESGRRAANAILAAEGQAPSCQVLALDEPFASLQAKDQARFTRGQPWASPGRGVFYYLLAWMGAVSLRALFLMCLMSASTVIFGLGATVAAALIYRNFQAVWAALFGGACSVMTMGAGRLAPLACDLPVTAPGGAAVSVFWFGLYAITFGISLATLPKAVMARLGFPRRQGPWMAVVGGGPMLIGLFYVTAALFELRPFFWIAVFARTIMFLVCMRLRFRRHDASGLLLVAALPDLLGAFWTASALADTQALALALILGLTNVIVACALFLFPTETRWKLGFEKEAGNWLPLASVLIAFWGLYEILAAALEWLPLVWMTVACRLLFGTICVVASFVHGARRSAVAGPWRLELAGLAFCATAALLLRALYRGV
jgi:hypothetical protein